MAIQGVKNQPKTFHYVECKSLSNVDISIKRVVFLAIKLFVSYLLNHTFLKSNTTRKWYQEASKELEKVDQKLKAISEEIRKTHTNSEMGGFLSYYFPPMPQGKVTKTEGFGGEFYPTTLVLNSTKKN